MVVVKTHLIDVVVKKEMARNGRKKLKIPENWKSFLALTQID